MVDHRDLNGRLDTAFAALADPTRRDVVARLAALPPGATLPVTALAAPYAMSLQAVSKHLQVLERAKLIACAKTGRVRRCHLRPEPMHEAGAWIERHRAFWEGQFDALDHYLTAHDDVTIQPTTDEGEDR